MILRHQLATIIGRMVHHFQQVRTVSHYSEVLAIDDELLNFINTLPPHFALEADKSLDDTAAFIPVHRYLLVTEVLFVRNSLHMPYILRKLKTDRYARSRNACFESAMKDFDVRRAFQQTVSKDIQESLSNAYREFQTTLIAVGALTLTLSWCLNSHIRASILFSIQSGCTPRRCTTFSITSSPRTMALETCQRRRAVSLRLSSS